MPLDELHRQTHDANDSWAPASHSEIGEMPVTVDQIMTRKLLTIASDASLEDAAWGLSLKRVQGSPVKDDMGRVIGILSRNDVGVIARLPGNREALKASDAMTRVLYAVRVGDSVKAAARRFVETGCQELVVLNETDELVGLVTQTDLVRLLLRDDIDV
jgi:predicted transcriptional regulator